MKNAGLAIILFVMSISAHAQFFLPTGGRIAFSKVKQEQGKPELLQAKKIQVVLAFDSMVVGEYSDKSALKGRLSPTYWASHSADKFKESFITKFNQLGKSTKTSAQIDSSGADYRLVIYTTFLSTGYSEGISKEPAKIDAVCIFYDKAGKQVVLEALDHVPGQTFGAGDMDIISRVTQCYQKLGKDLYNRIAKQFEFGSPAED
ncbi:MAG: hypothetical protein JWO03_1163 [Bacteroidetes bacterium]|nr:hypothetical protein [Bacteroidota bacterium]